MAKPLPPPDMPGTGRPSDIPEILLALEQELMMAARAAAGYFTLSKQYDQVTSGPKKGRKVGLSIFHYKGSLDGVNVMDLELDLRKVQAEYLAHMLAPGCNVHAGELLEGLGKMQVLVNDALVMVRTALGMNPSGKPQALPGKPTADDDFGEEEEDIEEVTE